MHFLIDANLPRSVSDVIRGCGHESIHVNDVGLRAASDAEIAQYARIHRLCIVTRDTGFGDVRLYPPENYNGLVVVALPSNTSMSLLMRCMQSLFATSHLVDSLPGNLAVVSPGRVRVHGAGGESI